MAKAKSKKPAAKKPAAKKISTRKKSAKPTVNPHQGKRYFLLDVGGYGGEYVVGRATEEFVEYWLDPDRSASLSDHVQAMHSRAAWGDVDTDEDEENCFDENSPEVSPGTKYVEYWELDDIEHDTVVSAEHSSITVTEVDLHPKAVYRDGALEWDDKETKKRNFDWSQKIYVERGDSQDFGMENARHVFCTELFLNKTKKGVVDPVPVLMVYDAQKGSFYRLIVETQGEDFDINKLVLGVNENSMTTHITHHYYDRQLLSTDHDYLSTWGKGFYAEVGWIPRGDLTNNFDELLEQGWKDLEDAE